jgi:DNA repair protein RAD5
MATSDKKKDTVTFNIRRSDGFKTSSKLDALLRYLRQSLDEKTTTGEPIKSVVFSQFTTFLDLIEVALTIEGIPFTRLDGTLSQLQREVALREFREGDITVMLISLRAGGVGLNLTCASKVYMMVIFCPLKALLKFAYLTKQTISTGPVVELCYGSSGDRPCT